MNESFVKFSGFSILIFLVCRLCREIACFFALRPLSIRNSADLSRVKSERL